MRIVHFAGREEVSPKKARKPTAKQIREERVNRLIHKLRMRDYNKVLKDDAERIAKIKKELPGWELPRPIFGEV